MKLMKKMIKFFLIFNLGLICISGIFINKSFASNVKNFSNEIITENNETFNKEDGILVEDNENLDENSLDPNDPSVFSKITNNKEFKNVKDNIKNRLAVRDTKEIETESFSDIFNNTLNEIILSIKNNIIYITLILILLGILYYMKRRNKITIDLEDLIEQEE